ncbi:hypothetical protein FPSE_04044 [Fusarium pseudograminearum CS3096]|uniref:NACHT domain-containing protein n=1 Tax=Fusarium pseudograminearum (strain CS3096) TaxID=1028729 RepID=K3VMF6_FUSPC|nr:hypothetical protein FPSE_04044 [Fusarium pseudograminearum CS3096]EKJ75864.1 hypothetical protein FPSE_04044 [Fusarium pseudograminearum CS3096]
MLNRLSVGLPPEQVSRRIEPVDNTASVLDPRPRDEVVVWPIMSAENSPIYSSRSNSYNTLQKQQKDLQQLWKEAIDKFEASLEGMKLSPLLQAQEQINTGDSTMELSELLANLEEQMKRVGLRGKIADTVGKVAPHINRIAIVGDVAVSANPMPAALPWAAVRFILLNVTAGEEIRVKIFEGIAEIITLIFECSVYRELYLTAEDTKSLSAAKRLREAIVEALCQCIKFLAFALRRQQAVAKALTDAFRLEDFSGYLKDLYAAKLQLHDAGSLCEMYHSSHGRELLEDLRGLIVDMRKTSDQRLEQEAKSQLKNLVFDYKATLEHVQHPLNSFCLEGTRRTVLQDIHNWADDGESPTICWLPGLAGTGKSTVSRTIARDLKGRCLGGCFFFKKGAGNRADGRTIFSIIAYQLALNFRPVRQHIINAVQESPSPEMLSMEEQWRNLIRDPLDKVQDKEFARSVVLVIDALDECDKDYRQGILSLLATCPSVLKVFITSRPEFDIEAHFARQQQFHREISLHCVKTVDIESDITMFLRHRIHSFLLDHNSCHPQTSLQLNQDWPGRERFQILVERSIPLFIAAATFVRLIENTSWIGSPDSRLNSILGKSNQHSSTYGTIYKPVLDLILNGAPAEARAKAHGSFIRIIGSIILLASPLSMTSLAVLLGVGVHDVAGIVNPLRSVLQVPRDDGPVTLFHLSFRDFLLSEFAGHLQVDEASTHAELASRCLKHLEKELRTDICGLGSPGKNRSDIDTVTINRHITRETQYASLYWVHHLVSSGKEVQDNDEEHQFLKSYFLNWIEVLCLTRRLFESLTILHALLEIVNEESGSEIIRFVQDAIKFIRFFREGIEETPLQLYHSGIIFSPSASVVPQPLENRRCPESVTRLPAVDSDWPQSLHAFETGDKSINLQLRFLSNNHIVTWGFRTDVKIWNISSGSCLQTLKYDIRFSDKTKSLDYKSTAAIGMFGEENLLAVGRNERIEIWDFSSQSFIDCLTLNGRLVLSVAFSDDGTLLCSVLERLGELDSEPVEPVLHIHNLHSRACINKVQIRNDYSAICLSMKGQWLACVADEQLWLSGWDSWNGLDWVNLGPQGNKSPRIQFSSDGLLLAVTSNNGCFRTWRTGTKQCTWALQYPYQGSIAGLSLTQDWLAVSSRGHQTVIFSLKTGTVSHEMGKIADGNLAISDDAKLLAMVSEGHTVRVWDLFSKEMSRVETFHPNAVTFLTMTPDESTVVSACTEQVKVWDIPSGLCIHTFGESCPMIFRIATEDGSLFATRRGYDIEIWSLHPWRQVQSMRREVRPFIPGMKSWAISENGERLAVLSVLDDWDIYSIEIWDVFSGSLLDNLAFLPRSYPNIALSPDGSRIAYTTGNCIEIRQISAPCKLLTRIEGVGMFVFTSLSFHGRELVAISSYGDKHGNINVWDTETGKLSTSCPTRKFGLTKSFINHEALLGQIGPDGLRQNVLKEFQVSDDKSWIMRGGKRLLWLPLDYRPHIRFPAGYTAYSSGSTIVIGTELGRVLILRMRE